MSYPYNASVKSAQDLADRAEQALLEGENPSLLALAHQAGRDRRLRDEVLGPDADEISDADLAMDAAFSARSIAEEAGLRARALRNFLILVFAVLAIALAYRLLSGSEPNIPAGTPVDTAAPGTAAPAVNSLSNARSSTERLKSPRAPSP